VDLGPFGKLSIEASVDGDERFMCVSKRCTATDEPYRLFLEAEAVLAWRTGELIQNAFPELPAEEREFLLTGLTPAEQDVFYANFQED